MRTQHSLALVVPVVNLALALAACPAPPPPPPPPPPAFPVGVEVIAGVAARGVVDGAGPLARFSGPGGLCATADGRTAYVSDTFVGIVRQVDVATGTVTTILGEPFTLAVVDGPAPDIARFNEPRGMAVSPDGSTLWVGDGPALRRVDLATMEVTTVAGDERLSGDVDAVGLDARFSFLMHDLEDDGTTLYIADRLNDKVRAMDHATLAVTTLASGFDGPGGLTRDGATLYVANTFAGEVAGVAVVDGAVSVVGAGLGEPQGVELVDGKLFTLGFGAQLLEIAVADGDVRVVHSGDPDGATFDGADDGDGNIGGTFASLARSADGRVLLMDLSSSALRAVEIAGGAVTTLAGPVDTFGHVDGDGADARFNGPFNVEVNVAGDGVFVADTFNHAIRAVSLDGKSVTTLAGGVEGFDDGPFAEARFSFPIGLAIDVDGQRLFVADSGNQRIRVIDLAQGTVDTVAGNGGNGGVDGDRGSAELSDPWEVEFDGARGKLYVTDSSGSQVRRVDVESGAVDTILGAFGDAAHVDGPLGTSRIRVPIGLALDGARLFVGDFESHTIRAVDVETLETTTALGTEGFEGFVEGDAAVTLLSSPSSLTVADGFLYIAEGASSDPNVFGNNVIRRAALDDLSNRAVVGVAGHGAGLPSGALFSVEEATLFAPEDVAVVAGALVIVNDNAVVRAVLE